MAKLDIPYFRIKPGRLQRDGTRARRYYWEPSAELAKEGWKLLKLGRDFDAAVAAARQRNAQVQAWRQQGLAAAVAAAEGRPVLVPSVPLPDGVKRRGGKPRAGSVKAMIAHLRASDDWADLAPATRRNYAMHLARLEAWAGDDPAREITPVDAQALYDELRKVSLSMANGTMRTARLAFAHGRRTGFLGKDGANPFAEPKLKAIDAGGQIWPRRAVQEMIAEADAMGHRSIGDAIAIAEWFGLRKMDLLRLPPIRRLLQPGGLSIVPAKTASRTGARAILRIDLVPQLVARLQDAAARYERWDVAATTAIVCERTRRPWGATDFTHVLAEIRASLARRLPDFEQDDQIKGDATVRTGTLTLKQLRATAITRLAEAGNTTVEIAAITGQSLKTIDELLDKHYIARTATMATTATNRRLDADDARQKKEQG